MNLINIDVVPVLPMNGVFAGECVAMGIFDNGVVVSYIERDIAILLTWDEIVLGGQKFLDTKNNEPEPEREPGEIREFVEP